MNGLAKGVTRFFAVFLILFIALLPVSYYGYDKTNDEVYYDMGQCLPEDMEYVIANTKLSEEFDIASTHMVLVDASLSSKDVTAMIDEMEQVEGVKYVLGLESVIGSGPANAAKHGVYQKHLLIRGREPPAAGAVEQLQLVTSSSQK